MAEALGVRLNNPLNIRASDDDWRGKVGEEKGFVRFKDRRHGLRAADRVIGNYKTLYGINTVSDLANRFAPPSENDTEKYINDLVQMTGLQPDEDIDLDDPDVRLKLVQTMARLETGQDIPDEDILAAQGRAGSIILDEAQGDESDEYSDEEPLGFDEYSIEPDELRKGRQRAAIWAAIAHNPEDPYGAFKQMKREMNSFGSSNFMDSVSRSINTEVSRTFAMELAAAARNKELPAGDYSREIERLSNIKTAALENLSADESMQDYPAAQGYARAYQILLDEAEAREGMIRAIRGVAAQGSMDGWDITADFADMLTLVQAPLAGASKEILGEGYYVMGGDMIRDLADWVTAAPKDQWEQRVVRVAESIREHAGLLTNNDVVTAFALMTLEDYLTPGAQPSDMERYIHNVASFTEVIGILPISAIAKGAARLIRRGSRVGRTDGAAEAVLEGEFIPRDVPPQRGGPVGEVRGETLSAGQEVALPELPTPRQEARQAANNARSAREEFPKLPAPIDEVQRASPRAATDLYVRAMDDPELAEELLGTADPNALLMRAMPSQANTGFIQGLPQELMDELSGVRHIIDDIETIADNMMLYAPEVWKAKERAIRGILHDQNIVAVARPQTSQIIPSDDKNIFTIRAVYGNDTDYPLTLGQAQALGQMLKERAAAEGVDLKPEVIAQDLLTGVFRRDNIPAGERSYLVVVDQDYQLMFTDMVSEVPKSRGAYGGKWLLDPRNLVNESLMAAIRTGADRNDLIFKRSLKIADRFFNLNNKGRRKVSELIIRGDDTEHLFSYEELKYLEGLNDQEILAYQSVRLFYDTLYRTMNAATRKELINNGYTKEISLQFNGKTYENALKEVTDGTLLSRTDVVFNPYLNQQVRISADNIDEIRSKNGMVFRQLRVPIDVGPRAYHFILAKPQDISDLRSDVIPQREGYAYRVNIEPYFVDRYHTKIVDGKRQEVRTTIGTARTKNDANILKTQFDSEMADVNVRHEVRVDRNIDSGKSPLGDQLTYREGGNHLWFSKKGDRLETLKGKGAIEDPLSSLMRYAHTVASRATLREAVQAMEVQHHAKYGHLMVQGEPLWRYDPKFNTHVFNPDNHALNTHELRRAKNEWDYLQSLKYLPTHWDKAWRGVLEYVDDQLAKTSLRNQSGLLSTSAARLGIDAPLKSMAFIMLIGMRPNRQLPLQWLSMMSMAGHGPIKLAQSFGESVPLMISMGLYDKPEMWAKFKEGMRVLGYSPEEWDAVFEAFRKSGKPYSIDSDIAIAEAGAQWSREMANSTTGQIAKDLKSTAMILPRTMQFFGFSAGELGNQATAWAFARRHWQERNPDKIWNANQRNLDEISDMARDFSFDMTTTNAMWYQRGAFGPALQFAAITHKAALKLIFGQKGLRSYKDRARYILAYAAMFGAAGFGLGDMYEKMKHEYGWELPPDADNFISGGVFSLAFNRLMAEIFDEDEPARTDVSGSFAVGSGIGNYVPDMYKNLLEGNIFEAFVGSSGAAIDKIRRVSRVSNATAGRIDIDTPEKLVDILFRDIPAQFGTFSDIYRYERAMELYNRTGKMYSIASNGTLLSEVPQSELFAKALLGVELKSDQEIFDVVYDLNAKIAGKKRSTIEKQARKDAEALAMIATEEYIASTSESDYAARMSRVTIGLHGTFYGRIVLEQLEQVIDFAPRWPEFIAKVISDVAAQDPDAELDSLINTVRTMENLDDRTKEGIIVGLEAEFRSRDLIRGDQ